MPSDLDVIQNAFLSGKIGSKKDYYALYNNGMMGNKPLTWNSYDELLSSSWRNGVSIRSCKGIARSQTRFNVPFERIQQEMDDLKKSGVSYSEMVFNQSMPDDKLLIQGEINRTENGIYLHYSNVKKPMNLALKEEPKHAFGLKAEMILKNFLFPQSYADLMELFEVFPDSVIEFGAYSTTVGNTPGRNTIVWEVRNY
jgi:hypothetical protein